MNLIKRLKPLLTITAIIMALPIGRAYAENLEFTYSGRLTDPSGRPIPGPIAMKFEFFHQDVGGGPVATITDGITKVPLVDGLFAVTLSISPAQLHTIFPSINQPVFIEISDLTHNPSAPYPRQKFSFVPYALKVPVDETTMGYDSDGLLRLNVSRPAPAGQYLTTDGDGNLQWSSPPGSGGSVGAGLFTGGNATDRVLTVKGAAGQSGNLQEWQSSGGSTLSAVDKFGNIGIGTSTPGSAIDIAKASGNLSLSGGGSISLVSGGKVGINPAGGNTGLLFESTTPKLSLQVEGADKLVFSKSGDAVFSTSLNVTNRKDSPSTIYTNDINTQGLVVQGSILTPSAAAPNTIAGLVQWFKADSLALNDGDAVTSWTDSSPSGFHATPAGAPSTAPVFKTGVVNGKPAVRFNGTSSALTFDNTAVASLRDATIFLVTKKNGSHTGWPKIWSSRPDINSMDICIFTQGSNMLYNMYGQASLGIANVINNFQIMTFKQTSSTHYGYVNSGAPSTVAAGWGVVSGPSSGFLGGAGTLNGATDSSYFNGDIAEIIVFNQALNDADRAGVEAYLANKYNIITAGAQLQQANLQEWKDASGSTMTAITPEGAMKLPSISDASAPNGSLFKCADHGNKLCFKDDAGTVHQLY